MIQFNGILCLIGGILGMVGFIISLICVAIVAGFTRSTHSVQYLPHDNTEAFKPDADLVAENEKALLDKVGKKKKEEPTVLAPIDDPLVEVTQSDFTF